MLVARLNLRKSTFIVVSEDLFALLAIYLAQFDSLKLFLLLNVTSRYIIRCIDCWRGILVQLHYLLEMREAVTEVSFRTLISHRVASIRR